MSYCCHNRQRIILICVSSSLDELDQFFPLPNIWVEALLESRGKDTSCRLRCVGHISRRPNVVVLCFFVFSAFPSPPWLSTLLEALVWGRTGRRVPWAICWHHSWMFHQDLIPQEGILLLSWFLWSCGPCWICFFGQLWLVFVSREKWSHCFLLNPSCPAVPSLAQPNFIQNCVHWCSQVLPCCRLADRSRVSIHFVED